MRLNCDMGESYGDTVVGDDAGVMPHIDQANIACGFHGGDPVTIDTALALARSHGVAVGAHPSYPDREGFGRRSMSLSFEELAATLHYQVAALEGMAARHGLQLSHIKPHGALYNDAMRDERCRRHVMQAIAAYHRPLPLVLQATARNAALENEARTEGVTLWFEAFADRAYTDDGLLQPRSEPGSVLGVDAMLAQAQQLVTHGTVTTTGGKVLAIEADTLCVHGDNHHAIAGLTRLRTLLNTLSGPGRA